MIRYTRTQYQVVIKLTANQDIDGKDIREQTQQIRCENKRFGTKITYWKHENHLTRILPKLERFHTTKTGIVLKDK